MNKSRKGWSRELQCRKELEEQGWTILFKSQSIRFGKVDFGPQNEKHEEAKFDVVAVKSVPQFGVPNFTPVWRFISCKHFGKSNNYLSHQQKIKEFKSRYNLGEMLFELWLWKSPRWTGRGKNKVWQDGQWKKIQL